jgi:cytochrome c-type biogenesis protein
MLLASITAYENTGDLYFLEQSEGIANYSLTNLYDWKSAGFFERHSTSTDLYTEDELLLTSKPAFGNGAMALGMLKLFNATKNPIYLDAGLKTITMQGFVPGLDDGYYVAIASKYALDNNLTGKYPELKSQILQLESTYRANSFLYEKPGLKIVKKPDFSNVVLSNLPTTNFLILLPIAIIAGILSFLSPCCFSLIPAYFAHTVKTKGKILVNSIGFFLGLGLLLAAIGGIAAFLGSFAVNQGKLLFGQFAGILMIILGVMNIAGMGFSGLKISSKAEPSNFRSSVAFGTLFGLGWSPCIGPVLLSLFALAANSSTITEGMILLLAYAAGLSLPLLLMSVYFERLDRKGRVWSLLQGKEIVIEGTGIRIHSTSLLSGLLLIVLGLLMATGYLFALNSLTPQWIQQLEGNLIDFFMQLK